MIVWQNFELSATSEKFSVWISITLDARLTQNGQISPPAAARFSSLDGPIYNQIKSRPFPVLVSTLPKPCKFITLPQKQSLDILKQILVGHLGIAQDTLILDSS